jgi:hypothetical protein
LEPDIIVNSSTGNKLDNGDNLSHRRNNRELYQTLPIGDGKLIQPTGKKFSINICTAGHWEDSVMIEEWLFWDSATYMKQMGIGN